MKILNAMFGCGLGGIEQAMVDYCDALKLMGHEPIALIHPRAEIKPLLIARKIPFHVLPNAGVWDPIAVFRLKRLLERIEPDLCIAHGNRAVGLLVRSISPSKVIAVMHNYKIKTDKAHTIFYPTQDLRRHIEKHGSHNRSFLIPNMVHAPQQQPKRSWHTPPVIGTMGRFVAKKGFDLFIEALSLLQSRGIAFKAVLAGDGEEIYALKTLATLRGINDVLVFPGWAHDKHAFFDGIDIFCLPSHHEPFGIVLLEALAQGIPVVATKSEGPSEILNETNGVLVTRGNALTLADALEAMLEQPARAQELAHGGFNTIKERYDLPVVAAKLDLALREISRL